MEHDFLIGKGIKETDKELFFGPLSSKDNLIFLSDNIQWAEILSDHLKIFSSRSQARKADERWGKPIPEGWTDLTIGKKRIRICILKITEDAEIQNDD